VTAIAPTLLPGIESAARFLHARSAPTDTPWEGLTDHLREVYLGRAAVVAATVLAARDQIPAASDGTEARRLAGPVRQWFDADPARAEQDHVVIPRVLAQSMPLAWQRQLAELLDELTLAYQRTAQAEYEVTPVRRVAPLNASAVDLAAAGIVAWTTEDDIDVYSRVTPTGDEDIDAHALCVPVTVPDPLPDWRGGYVAPIERGDR
jgi:hypothetical protein